MATGDRAVTAVPSDGSMTIDRTSGDAERSQLVRLDVTDGVATVTLDSPANRNALSAQLRSELLAQIRRALDLDTVRVLVLTHTGPAFCAGADLREARSGPATGPDFTTVLELLWSAPVPVIARLAGPARAGGVGLVAACDFAVAADSVTFAFTEVRLGVIPAVISAPLRHRVAAPLLHRLFLTGETFDAARAASLGLLSSIAPLERLDEEVQELVDMLQLGAPGAMAACKRLMQVSTLQPELDSLQELSAHHFTSEEGREGVLSFTERRAPVWATRRG